MQRSQARQRILTVIDNLATHRVDKQHIAGNRHRKVKTTALLSRLDTRRFALPTYVLAYRYKESLYRVVVSGQDAACLRGSAPYSMIKILFVIVLGLSIIVAAATAFAYF